MWWGVGLMGHGPLLENIFFEPLSFLVPVPPTIFCSATPLTSGVGKLHIIEGTMNGKKYREILEYNLLPSAR